MSDKTLYPCITSFFSVMDSSFGRRGSVRVLAVVLLGALLALLILSVVLAVFLSYDFGPQPPATTITHKTTSSLTTSTTTSSSTSSTTTTVDPRVLELEQKVADLEDALAKTTTTSSTSSTSTVSTTTLSSFKIDSRGYLVEGDDDRLFELIRQTLNMSSGG